MILQKEIEVLVRKNDFEYYNNLGYNFNEIGYFTIKTIHLKKNSHIKILCKCDDCSLEKLTPYQSYNITFPKWNKYLCLKCSQKYKKKFNKEEIVSKRKLTSLKNWNVDNPSKSTLIKEKKKQTTLKNWGVENPLQLTDYLKENNLKKFGVEYNSQRKDVKETNKETIKNRYGVHFSQLETVKEKKKQTTLKNWNVDNPSKCIEIQNKKKTNNILKYNVENTSQLSSIKEKIKSTTKSNIIQKYSDSIFTIIDYNEDYFTIQKNETIFELKRETFYKRIKDCIPLDLPIKQSIVSIPELELQDFLKKLNIEFETSNRKILNGRELDILIPSLNIAIEFNGIYYHSNKFVDENYHYKKSLDCIKNNILLIHIYELDWINNKQRVLDDLKNKLFNEYFSNDDIIEIPFSLEYRKYKNYEIIDFIQPKKIIFKDLIIYNEGSLILKKTELNKFYI